MRYHVEIETKDVPYNLGSAQGDPADLYKPENWCKVKVTIITEPAVKR